MTRTNPLPFLGDLAAVVRTRTWRAGAAVLWAAVLTLGPNAGAEEATKADAGLPVIRIGYPVWVGFGTLLLAEEKGFFRQHGVKVEMVKIDDPKIRWAALASGELQGLASGVATIPLYVKPSFQVRCVLPLDESFGADGIVALKTLRTPKDLRGRTVAYNQGAITEYYLNYVLEQAGVRIGEIRGVNMKPDDAAAAFFAGRVDAAVTWEPWLTKAKTAEHGHVLHNTSEAPGVVTDCLAMPAKVIAERPTAIRGVILGWFQAVDYVRSNRDEAIRIMAKKVGGWLEKPEDFAATLEGVRYFDRDSAARYFKGTGTPAERVARDALGLWGRQGKADPAMKASDLLDNTMMP